MKNACLVFIVFQVLKVLLMKILKMQPPIFYFLLFLLPFTLAESFLQIFKTSFNIQLYIANSIDPVNIAPVEEKYLFCSVQKHLLRVNSKDCNNVLNLFSVIHLNFRIQINVDDFRKMIQFPFSSMEFFLPTQKIKIHQNIF